MRLKKFLDLWLKLALMIDKAWEKFEKKIEKEERIKKIKSEYYAKIDAEISEKMQQTTNNWKNITENQKEIQRLQKVCKKNQEYFVSFVKPKLIIMDIVIANKGSLYFQTSQCLFSQRHFALCFEPKS